MRIEREGAQPLTVEEPGVSAGVERIILSLREPPQESDQQVSGEEILGSGSERDPAGHLARVWPWSLLAVCTG